MLVVDLREVHPIDVALAYLRGLVHRVLRREPPVPGIDRNAGTARRALALQGPHQILILSVQQPAVGDRQNGFTLLADAPEKDDEVLEGVDRPLLVSTIDHLLGDPVLVGAPIGRRHIRIACPVLFVLGIGQNQPAALAPVPVAGQKPLDGRRLPGEGDVLGRHLGRHHAHEIVGADEAVQRVHQRFPDAMGPVHLHVIRVEEHDEHPGA